MKTKYLLTPLALALATVLSAGAYATGQGSGGNASITDSQENYNNEVRNEGTNNNASVNDSLNGAAGNVGVNVAAGDNNQQANAAAIATADASFIFGNSASASVDVSQEGRNNNLKNFSVPNNASLNNSASGASGNIALNIASGNYNQQKNDMAIGVSENALSANASSTVSQISHGNVTKNESTMDMKSQKVTLSGGVSGDYSGKSNSGEYQGRTEGDYKGVSDQWGNVYLDSWSGGSHQGGDSTGHVDVDNKAQGAKDLNKDGGALAFKEDGEYEGTERGSLSFRESGTADLSGSFTGNIPVTAGFKAPVVNNASVNNSLNGATGNIGVNVTSGGGNQQSNSLSIAAGCNACAASAGGGGLEF